MKTTGSSGSDPHRVDRRGRRFTGGYFYGLLVTESGTRCSGERRYAKASDPTGEMEDAEVGRRRGPKWGALLAAGYDAGELKEIIAALDYGRFKDEAIEDRFPMGKTLSFLKDLCIYGGKALED